MNIGECRSLPNSNPNQFAIILEQSNRPDHYDCVFIRKYTINDRLYFDVSYSSAGTNHINTYFPKVIPQERFLDIYKDLTAATIEKIDNCI